MSQPVMFKEDSEIKPWGWDYGDETVQNVNINISPVGLAQDGAAVISGSTVYANFKDGTAGQIYEVIFETTTNVKTYVDKFFVKVYSV